MVSRPKDDGMDVDSGLHINLLRFNLPQIAAAGSLLIAGAMAYSSITARLDKIEESRSARSVEADKKFTAISNAIDPLTNIPYRVTLLESQISATNQRMDRASELVQTTLELIRKDVNNLTSDVRVLGSQVETVGGKVDALSNEGNERRTDMRPPAELR